MTDDISGSRLFEYVYLIQIQPKLDCFFFNPANLNSNQTQLLAAQLITTYILTYQRKLKYISQGHMHIYILRYLPLKRAMHCKK